MKLAIPENMSLEDISVVSLSMYHTLSKAETLYEEPSNSVEYTNQEHSRELLNLYFSSLEKSLTGE